MVSRTYSEITNLLNRFQAGEDGVILDLENTLCDLNSQVAQRLIERMSQAMNERLKVSQDLFCKVLVNNDQSAISLELASLKKRLQMISRLTRLPFLPPQVSEMMQNKFSEVCREIEQSLKRNTKSLEINLLNLDPYRDAIKDLPVNNSNVSESGLILRRKKHG